LLTLRYLRDTHPDGRSDDIRRRTETSIGSLSNGMPERNLAHEPSEFLAIVPKTASVTAK
jgi:hypothetical protein